MQKKSKLLISLASVSAIGTLPPTLLSATACNNESKDTSIKSLTITTNKTQYSINETIKKEDIRVIVNFIDPNKQSIEVTDWTCDDINETTGFTFKEPGDKTFNIVYHSFVEKLIITCIDTSAKLVSIEVAPVGIETKVFIGQILYKNNLVVTAKYSNGNTKVVDDWTCELFGAKDSYTFHELGDVTFTIIYQNVHTNITFNAAAYGFMTFSKLMPPNLCVNKGFATEEKFHVYGIAFQKPDDLHEIDPDLLTITTTKGDDGGEVAYNKETHLLRAITKGTATIKAHYADLPESVTDYDATLEVAINDDSITFAEQKDTQNAQVRISKASYLTNVIKIPEYVWLHNNDLKVTSFLNDYNFLDDMIDTIYIPSSINTIGKGTFNRQNKLRYVLYQGTKAQWSEINTDEKWAGANCVGAYCLGEEDWTEDNNFVYLPYRQDSKYDEDNKQFVTKHTMGDRFSSHNYVVAFDMQNVTDATATPLANFTKLDVINSSTLPTISAPVVNSIYVDGKKMTKDTDYNVDETTNHSICVTFTSSLTSLIDRTTRITIDFTNQLFTADSLTATLSYVA